MQELNQWFLKIADPLLNPLLSLPMDLVLCILAVGTAVLILLIRKMTTDQDFLRRCRLDRVRLRYRLKEARQAKNDHDVSRFKTVLSTIGFRAMKQEGLPLLVSL
ncbi:MAG: hypothetical protein QF473_36100, partial [Planctomycetota bacterium]|nr:hypothetical protein [Planctomycetota bacterium]